MSLDATSVWAMTALVVNVCGVAYVVQMLLRRDRGGRLWALAFLAAMATTLCYLTVAVSPGSDWAVAAGNALFAGGIGCLWLGALEVNGHRLRIPVGVVVVVVVLVAVNALAVPADPGGWQGAPAMFAAVAGLAAAGGVECFRGRMRRVRTSVALLVGLGMVVLFYLARLIVSLAVGVESAVFRLWLSSAAANMLTITLSVVALLATALVRVEESDRARVARDTTGLTAENVLTAGMFLAHAGDLAKRAQWHGNTIGVIVVYADDLPRIERAFGNAAVHTISTGLRKGAHRHAPATAIIGEDGTDAIAVGVLVESETEVRQTALEMYRGVFEETSSARGGIVPVLGVGAALSDSYGYDIEVLLRTARTAARSGADGAGLSVIIAPAPTSYSAAGESVSDAADGLDPTRR